MFNTVEEGKDIAIISYLTIIGAIVAILMNNEKKNTFAAFHIRQALGLSLMFLALGYSIGYFDSWMATSAFYLFFFILWIYGFMSAIQGQTRPIPLLGNLLQKLFKNLE